MEEEFQSLIEELRGNTLIVEGKKDVQTLGMVGLKKIVALNGRPLINVVEELRKKKVKKVVILTDFDHAGRRLAAGIRYLLQQNKIKTNPRLRQEFMSFGKNKIEDYRREFLRGVLSSSVKLKEGDYHGEVGANINKVHSKGIHKGQGRCGEARCDRCNFWSNRGSSR
jgi:5S rRNA maturation endonuclease (ribonuclease M5)